MNDMVRGTNDPVYVAASLAIAVTASWVALDLTGRISVSRGRSRMAWLLAGAVVMGIGIWNMHFIAMMGLKLETVVAYRVSLVLLSVLEAIGASAAALWVSSRPLPSRAQLLSGTVAMTAAIVGMHYTGMAAMELRGHVDYNAALVGASVAIAAVASYVALRLAVHLRDPQGNLGYKRAAAAMVMGAAIVGMHYTGMLAAGFHADPNHAGSADSMVGSAGLAEGTAVGTALILVAALVASALDRRWRTRRATMLVQARLAAIVDAVDDALFSVSTDRRVLTWNAGAMRIYGYTPEEAIGMSLTELVAPANASRLLELFDSAVAGTVLKQYDTVHARRDGAVVDVSLQLAPIRANDGATIAVSVIVRDISDRKHFDRALVSSQQELAGLIAAMSDVIMILGADGRYLKIFHTRLPSLVRPPDELLGRTIHEMLPAAGAEYVQARITEALTASDAVPIEYALPIDGSTVWFSGNVSALGDGRVLWIARDVTARKEGEARERSAREAADAANRAKGDFLANMSHEIRTPMNGVLGMLELTLDTELSASQREYLALAHSSAEALLTIINDILDFSKIEAGILDLNPAPFNLADATGETVSTMALRAYRKGLELTLTVSDDVPEIVVGDAGRLRQVLVNIMGNAVKFTSTGEVSVRVELATATTTGTMLHFSVRDTGIGIAPDKQAAVFGAFVQADASTTRDFGGTGLGLAISRQIVEAMGGRCWLESTLGVGTTFHFTVAMERGAESAPANEPTAVTSLAGVRVLAVDDNGTNRQMLQELLRKWDMRVTCVDGGVAGLNALSEAEKARDPYRIVLLDACMPGMDGFAFAATLRNERRSGIPIMMLSSSGGRDELQQCEALGIGTYVMKPIRRHSLLSALSQALGEPNGSVAKNVAAAAPALPDGAALRILVAEDNPVNQKLAEALLTKRGHAVVIVGDGQAALDIIAQRTFDVVLMDAQMPIMGGLEATTLLRERERESHEHLPVVAMTARAMAGDRERCLSAGMDDYISKPIRLDDLARVLGAIVARRVATGSPRAAGAQEEVVAAALLDEGALLELLGGDEELLRELYDIFLQDAVKREAAIRTAGAHGDLTALASEAHALKGAASNLSALALALVAGELERVASSDDRAAAACVTERTLTTLRDTVAQMTQACARLSQVAT